MTLSVQSLIVARNQGRSTARAARKLDRRFQAWIAKEDYEHAREMARFYLDVMDDAPQAARLARINYALQKEHEDRVLVARTARACVTC